METSRPGRRQPGSLGGEPPGPTDRPKRSGAEEESFGRDREALNLNEEEQRERGRENTHSSLFLFFRVIGATGTRPVKSSSSSVVGIRVGSSCWVDCFN